MIVILGSNRKNGNTSKFVPDTLSISTEYIIDLLDYTIYPYNYDEQYPVTDQFNYIVDQLIKSNTIILATPVYWYAMSGLMKTFFDRLTDLVTINKHVGRQLKGKSLKILVTGSDTELPVGFEVPFKGTAEYFDMVYEGCWYRSVKE